MTPAGTIGTHSLTVAELPAHTHGRGTTNITGGTTNCIDGGNIESVQKNNSAFQFTVTTRVQKLGGSDSVFKYAWNDVTLNFDASKGWSGVSESKGSGTAHGHSWTGTASTFSLMNPYKVAYCFIRIS